jgi:myo-inositol-1(or 4)-monophosphatase
MSTQTTLEPSQHEAKQILDLALRVAREAGDIQRRHYETEHQIATKSAAIDLVTEVDRACEAAIVASIRSQRPRDAILAEEGGGRELDEADWRWVVDPLDGTTNYAHGFPRFCVSLGVEYRGRRSVAAVYDPLLDELFHAVRGGGAWLGERRLRVSRETRLDRALVATGFAYDVHKSDEDNLASFHRVLKTARGIRRDGSAALDLCYVAAGRLDAYWEIKLHAWDLAAGLLIVEEAGGRTSNLEGHPLPGSEVVSGLEVVSSNGRVHQRLLSLVAPSRV